MGDKSSMLTTIVTRVDDTRKGSPVIQKALPRPGPAPHLSDSEIITVALFQEVLGELREDPLFRVHHARMQDVLPETQ